MLPTITAFAASPDRGRGLARDMQPFGQIPTCQFGDLTLFESGAIVLHIAERHHGLLPIAAAARARALSWMFAAISTVEPVILERESATLMEKDKPWFSQRMPMVDARIRNRLNDLDTRLGDAEWLDDAFSAGDLLMVQVLRRLCGSDLINEHQRLAVFTANASEVPPR
jgi:glutathione S-transferase